MNNKEVTLKELLQSRDDRVRKQNEIINNNNCSLICFTLNIPGPIKYNIHYKKIHDEGMKSITELIKSNNLKIQFQDVNHKITGSEGYIGINIEGKALKKLMVNIEDEHRLGRLFDIDVIDPYMNHISRRELNKEPRKCLICQKESLLCKREKSHTLTELLEVIHDLSSDYFQENNF